MTIEPSITETPLDAALITVHEAEDASEEARNKLEDEYYELFLNTVLYIPTGNVPEEPKEGVADEDIEIQPVIIEDESAQKDDDEGENKTYVMLFDTEERLVKWADGEKVGMVGLHGHDVISILGSANHMILNPSSECSKEFQPEEIEWLKASIIN